VNSGKLLTDNAEDNPEPSSRNREGATTILKRSTLQVEWKRQTPKLFGVMI